MASANTYAARGVQAPNPVAKQLLTLMEEKQTNLCVAADLTHAAELLELAEAVGPEICLLKTHVDIIEDFTPEFVAALLALVRRHRFLIFEDRKFADIGNTSALQYGQGVYHIVEWADLVNAHVVPGPGIIEGLAQAAAASGKERGLILLAQMSSAGNLATQAYTDAAVDMARRFSSFVVGFIANGGDVRALSRLRQLAGASFLLFAPGVKLGGGADALGQQYTTPADVVRAGADVIISGRGVYESASPAAASREYREAGWQAYQQRLLSEATNV